MSSTALAPPGTDSTNAGSVHSATGEPPAGLAWFVLAALWCLQAPLFLAMPLTNDAAVYDLHVRSMLQGGVLYREIFEPNLPGVVWIHWIVRQVCGWSSEALRGFDLAMFAATLGLVGLQLRRAGGTQRLVVWTAVAMSAFYFGSSEWVHCQRDGWLLVPALAALELRARQAQRLASDASRGRVFLAGLAEGLVWGAGVWLKPHVVFPAAAVWLITAWSGRRFKSRVAVDALGLLAGGVAAGAAGIGWMMATDAWPHFLETARTWNPRYLQAGKAHWTLARFLGMNVRMFPWPLVHVGALIAAAAAGLRAWRGTGGETSTAAAGSVAADDPTLRRLLLPAFYVAWTCQAFAFQHLFDYVHAPPILLGVATVAVGVTASRRRIAGYLALGALGLAIGLSPLLSPSRWSAWPECVRRGSTPEMRDRLRRLATPDWRHQEEVAEWLGARGVRQGDVLVLNDSLVHLYHRLGMTPPIWFQYVEQTYFLFPDYRDELRALIRRTPHRYAVTNLVESGWSYDETRAVRDGDPLAPPPAMRTGLKGVYPWSHRIVFRAGPYLVYEVSDPPGRLLLPAPRRPVK